MPKISENNDIAKHVEKKVIYSELYAKHFNEQVPLMRLLALTFKWVVAIIMGGGLVLNLDNS